MKRSIVKSCVGVLSFLLLLLPAGASAQAAWDAPLLLPPRPQPGFGIFLADVDGGELGVLATWRSSVRDYGLRFGLAEGSGVEDLTAFGGVDFMGGITSASTDFPVDIDWVLGAGLGVGDGLRITAPAGLSLGVSFQSEAARFVPYIIPRVFLDARAGNDNVDDDIDLGVAVDLGLDVRFLNRGPLAGRSIRFGVMLGDLDALALGIVF